jgi:hypothetical protein
MHFGAIYIRATSIVHGDAEQRLNCATNAVPQVNERVVDSPPTASRWVLRLTSLSCRFDIA